MWRLAVLACMLSTGCAATAEPRSAGSPSTSATGVPSSSVSPRVSPTPTPTPTPTFGRVVIAADSAYGPMLYDATGQPIYLFTAESGHRPACYDACAADWPPVLTRGEPRGRRGDVRGSLLGVTRRHDGSRQVTYAGHPLYFYAHEGRYQVLCHDVVEYGGTWLVVRPDGTPAPA